ncbi:MAG TPA: biotin/lipoyl-containing protein, partial [Pseudonocardia sp.]|nr:biotin/lipoyl-containing protein [Pseudonocardia sp.]
MGEFRMPSLGADMDSGTVLEWLVAPGDTVHRGDVVAVVDTDKAAIDVECFDSGVVERILVPPGRRVSVGTPLALIGAGAGGGAPTAEPGPPPGAGPPRPAEPGPPPAAP